MSDSSAGGNGLLIRKVRGKCFEMYICVTLIFLFVFLWSMECGRLHNSLLLFSASQAFILQKTLTWNNLLSCI